nr:ATP-binding protein [Haloplanus rubicundus]
MNDLLEDLLTLARTGETIDELTAVDFADVVDASSSNVATMRTTVAVAGSARIRCDPSRLKEAMENLLRNAVEHGSAGNRSETGDAVEHNEASVRITAGVLPDRTGVYVEDDGAGIPPRSRIGYSRAATRRSKLGRVSDCPSSKKSSKPTAGPSALGLARAVAPGSKSPASSSSTERRSDAPDASNRPGPSGAVDRGNNV